MGLVDRDRKIDNEVACDVGSYERSILRNGERTIFLRCYRVKSMK